MKTKLLFLGLIILFILYIVAIIIICQDVSTEVPANQDYITYKLNEIAENTHYKPFTLLNIGIATLSAVFAIFGAYYSFQTASEVKRVNKETQEKLLLDLIRHLYRNMVCTFAFVTKLKEYTNHYPADEHLLKLPTLPEDIHLERFNSNAKHYEKMHELSLLLRNYNTEIQVTYDHLINPVISSAVKERDLETLLFKPIYLINKICDVLNKVLNKKSSLERANIIILTEHFSKLMANYNHNVWEAKDKIDIAISVKVENWISKIIVKHSDKKEVKAYKKDLLEKYALCRNIAEKSNGKFTSDDLIKLNELNEINEKKREIKQKLDIDDEKELHRLQINNFNAVLMDETRCCTPDALQWNSLDLVIKALKTDVVIEYSKIGMIEYPGKKKK